MAHNNNIYPVWPIALNAQMAALGYKANISDASEGGLLTGRNVTQNKPSICNDVPLPSWLNADDYKNWPFNSQQETIKMMSKNASSEGVDDGWRYIDG